MLKTLAQLGLVLIADLRCAACAILSARSAAGTALGLRLSSVILMLEPARMRSIFGPEFGAEYRTAGIRNQRWSVMVGMASSSRFEMPSDVPTQFGEV
jgi:hypothetical protein